MRRYYRRDPIDEMAEDMVMTGVIIAGLIAVAIGVAIAELLRTPTEEKLLRLTPADNWGEWVASPSCPHCRSHQQVQTGYCPRCGRSLP
jgi:hypothetical protein